MADGRKIPQTSKSREKRSVSMGASSMPTADRRTKSEASPVVVLRQSGSQTVSLSEIGSSTALALKAVEGGLSSDQASPGREPGGSPGRELLSPVSEERRRKNSPRKFMVSSSASLRGSQSGTSVTTFYSGASSANSSPRSAYSSSPRTPHNSPESGYKSSSSSPRSAEDVLPISIQDIVTHRNAVKERLKGSIDKNGGCSYMAALRLANGAPHNYLVIASGVISQAFIIDLHAKLGEGSAGTVYVAYNLDLETRLVAKFFKPTALPELVIREANNLFVLGDLEGVFQNELNYKGLIESVAGGKQDGDAIEETKPFCIFMPLVQGVILSDYMYVLDARLKEENPKYKDLPAYFVKKKKWPYLDVIDITLTVVRALKKLHSVGLIHRDISGDNFMLENPENGRFIDLEVAVNVACDLYCTIDLPEKKNLINYQSLDSIKNKTGASYILCGKQLFYMNRSHNKLVDLKLSVEQLNDFDEKMSPTIKPRVLTKSEIEEISRLTGHHHLAPPFEGTNVAYGFAPPERSVSFESDYYMMGVLLADIVSGCNLMRSLKEDYASKLAEKLANRQETHLMPLLASELKAMVPDIFNEKSFVCTAKTSVEEYFYHAYVMKNYRDIINNLLLDDPRLRLQGSDLSRLDERIVKIREEFVSLTEVYTQIVAGLVAIQKLGVLLPRILLVIQESHQQLAKRDYFLGKVDELLNISSGDTVIDDSKDSLVLAMKRVTTQATKRQKLASSLSAILEGWDKIKDHLPDPELLRPLLNALCPNGTAAFEFLQMLPLAMAPQVKVERKGESSIVKGLK